MRAIWTLRYVAAVLGILTIIASGSADDSPFVGRLEPEFKPQRQEELADPEDSGTEAEALLREITALLEAGRVEEAKAKFELRGTTISSEIQTANVEAPPPEEAVPLDKPLAAVVVKGNKLIRTEDILGVTQTRAGQLPDWKRIKEDVHTLVRKRWFYTVEPRLVSGKKGPMLVYSVVERPVIASLVYVGNKALSEKELGEITCLKAGGPFDASINRVAAQRIQAHYIEHGYAHARVKLEQGGSTKERDVLFQIDEGPRVVVSNVRFTGNASIPAWELWLRTRTQTEQGFLAEGLYNRDSVPDDIAALKRHYHNRGFFDVKVTAKEGLSPDLSRVELEYVIDEGPQYKIGEIRFEGSKDLPEAAFRRTMKLRPGTVYDERVLDADKARIISACGARGCIVDWIDCLHTTREKADVVDLTFQIQQKQAQDPETLLSMLGAERPRAASPGHGPSPFKPHPEPRTTEPADLRDIDRLVLTGIETFDLADVRGALDRDFDLLLAAPHTDLFGYLGTLQNTFVSAYRHRGFPEANVDVALNHGENRIEVRVHEGPRSRCGELSVTGLRQQRSALLVHELTEGSKRASPLWKKGDPAPFDEGAEARLREKIQDELAYAGYFHPEFKIAIRPDPGESTAALAVTFEQEGPRATVGAIEVVGTKRDSPDDVLKYLDLHEGAPYDKGFPYRLEQRLSDSGRYLVHNVRETACALSAEVDSHALRIELRDYRNAPPLIQEFSPAEQALLKLREWIGRWADGKADHDIVVSTSARVPREELLGSWARPARAPAENAAEIRVELRTVIDPQRGCTISLTGNHPGERPVFDALFTASADRLVLASPTRKAALVLPNSGRWRSTFDVSMEPAERADADQPFRINFGVGLKTPKPEAPPFEVRARLAAAAMISLAHYEGSKFAFRDGVCEIRNRDFEIRIDAAGGRLIEYSTQSEGVLTTIRTEKEAFAAETHKLDAELAAPAIVYDPASPWRSALEFFLDESVAVIRDEGVDVDLATLAALRKLAGHWKPPGAGELFADAWSDVDDNFWIPSQRAGWTWEDLSRPNSKSRRNLIGMLLSGYRRLVPKTGWMWRWFRRVGRARSLVAARQGRRSRITRISTCGITNG